MNPRQSTLRCLVAILGLLALVLLISYLVGPDQVGAANPSLDY